MGPSYSETRDASGRTTIVLQDGLPALLIICCVLSVLPFFFFGWAAIPVVLANMVVFGSLSGWFLYARQRMRVTIDAGARTLAVETGPKPRVLAFGDILRAQLDSAHYARIPAASGVPPQLHRVELALRSGEVLPLLGGFGGFRAEDCQRLAERINAGLDIKC